jgi:hypothetical protein
MVRARQSRAGCPRDQQRNALARSEASTFFDYMRVTNKDCLSFNPTKIGMRALRQPHHDVVYKSTYVVYLNLLSICQQKIIPRHLSVIQWTKLSWRFVAPSLL